MQQPKTDSELFAGIKEHLYSAVVGDALDRLGFHHQFLPPGIRPIRDDMIVVGRAFPVLETDCVPGEDFPSRCTALSGSFGLMLEALDSLQEHDVYLCSGSSPEYAVWGEIMSCRARHLGAAGAVLNGFHRDTRGILALDFPVFSHGPYAQDQAVRGKVIDYMVPIRIGSVLVSPGDIVFGDLDGICIIPRQVEKEVLQAAFDKALGEKTVMKEVGGGMSARKAFEQYNIL